MQIIHKARLLPQNKQKLFQEREGEKNYIKQLHVGTTLNILCLQGGAVK